MIGSSVTVESGEILVQPSFADVLLCQGLGGRFSGRGWRFPATRDAARLLHRTLHAINGTPEFYSLLPANPAAAEMLALVDEHFARTPPEEVVANAQRLLAPPPAEIVEPDIVIPDGMLTRPWRHQRAAFRFATEHFAAGRRGVLLAMGMGTGKSLVACMVLLSLAARRVLIVCPLRVVPVWVTQFERHVDKPVVLAALDEEIGSVAEKKEWAAEKMKLAQTLGRPFVAVINYDSAWRDPFAAWAEKQNWDLVIADEQHRIKAPGGKASLFFKRMRLHANHRVGLTGTPMPHGPMDVYAQFRFLDMSIFGPSFTAFRTRYAVMGGFQRRQITGFQQLDELERLMNLITFRVGAEVLDLPPATDVTYKCDLSPEGARIYRDLEEDFVARVKDGTVTAANAMVKLLRLAQVTGGCLPTDDGTIHRIDTSKQKLLADTLEDIGDEPVVVFCRFTADLQAVHQACEGMSISSLELSGHRDEIKRWQDGEAQLLAVQIDAGGEGVDLTRARYSIFYSVGFSLGKYEQAKARTHRPGQNRPVEHIHLVVRNTVDVKTMRALEKRADIVNAILAEIKN
jgi:SNF2 family DNA or RNA helicase